MDCKNEKLALRVGLKETKAKSDGSFSAYTILILVSPGRHSYTAISNT